MAGTDTFEDMCRSRRTTAVLVALALASAACSGSNASDPVVTPAPPAAAGDTEPPPVTEAPTTTTTPTTTSTTVAPTTTIDETAALIAEIEADLNEGEAAYLRGGMAPGSPEAQELAASAYVGPALERTLERYAQFARDGLLLRPNPQIPNVIVVEAILDRADSTAMVDLCRVDASVSYQPLGESGQEVIFDDQIVRFRTTTQLVMEDGVWKVVDGTTNDRALGVDSCDI
jgi:hypothetical protein